MFLLWESLSDFHCGLHKHILLRDMAAILVHNIQPEGHAAKKGKMSPLPTKLVLFYWVVEVTNSVSHIIVFIPFVQLRVSGKHRRSHDGMWPWVPDVNGLSIIGFQCILLIKRMMIQDSWTTVIEQKDIHLCLCPDICTCSDLFIYFVLYYTNE